MYYILNLVIITKKITNKRPMEGRLLSCALPYHNFTHFYNSHAQRLGTRQKKKNDAFFLILIETIRYLTVMINNLRLSKIIFFLLSK